MIEKIFRNTDMGIELTSFIDDTEQNVWFKAKDIAKILGYRHVDERDKQRIFTSHASVPKTWTVAPGGSTCTYINESGFYSLVLSSKLETAKKFKNWVTSKVLPSIRKFGQYKLFKVTRPSFFGGEPPYFEALWYPHLYFYRKSNT